MEVGRTIRSIGDVYDTQSITAISCQQSNPVGQITHKYVQNTFYNPSTATWYSLRPSNVILMVIQ